MSAPTTIFERPIESLPCLDGVPRFLPLICDFIKARTSTPGLFRVSGSDQKVKQLAIDLYSSTPVVPTSVSVHDVCSLLKLWMCRLPFPLISPAIVNEVYDESNPNSIRDVLMNLPERNRKIVALLVHVVRAVIAKEDENHMGLSNMTTCFWLAMSQGLKGLRKELNFQTLVEVGGPLLSREADGILLLAPIARARVRESRKDKRRFNAGRWNGWQTTCC